MGNYKEGRLDFTLKEDTPMDIIMVAVDLADYNDDDYLPDKETRKERIGKLKHNNSDALFKSEYLDWIHLNLSFRMKDLDGSHFWDDDYFYRAYVRLIDSGFDVNLSNMEDIYCKSLEEVLTCEEMRQCVMRHKFDQVRISITYCSKYYDNEFDKLFNFFKPYIEETDECLGEIHDEDGYIRKDYYLDGSIYNRIIEKQKLMCEGCPAKRGRQENVKCENYEFCSVAYDNGVKNKSL